MKRFNELTKKQQDKVVTLIGIEMKECIDLGLLVFGKQPTEADITNYSSVAAEDAYYTEAGDRVINEMEWKYD